MKMKIVKSIALLLLMGCAVNAQNYISIGGMDAIKVEGNSFNLTSNVKGSKYVNSTFLPAKVINSNLIHAMRYNAYEDLMEVETDQGNFNLRKEMINSVTFEGSKKRYQTFTYEVDFKKKSRYFVVLADCSEFVLLNKEEIKFFNEVKPKSTFDKYKPAKLQRIRDEFYLGYKKGEAKPLPRKKKAFFKIFKEHSSDIASFVKKNKLGIRTQEEITKIFQYYETLK